MTWQEYQEAVALLYEQLEGIGTVQRNIRMPDLLTGQDRQIDVLLTIKSKGHEFRAVIDAKFHAEPIDVKVIEEVVSLAEAVGIGKTIIVTSNGWTAPAETKAEHRFCDLRLLGLEEALELIEPEMWSMCPSCSRDCIVMDQQNALSGPTGGWIWWLGGACRECRTMQVWCQDCGAEFLISPNHSHICDCNYSWGNREGTLEFATMEEDSR